jgi:hypothetical protein
LRRIKEFGDFRVRNQDLKKKYEIQKVEN